MYYVGTRTILDQQVYVKVTSHLSNLHVYVHVLQTKMLMFIER